MRSASRIRSLPRLAATLLVAALTATACASPSSERDAASDEAAAADEAQPLTVEHAMGTTEVPCTPQRVVTLGQGQTDSTLALGVIPVGVVEPWTADWYDYLPTEVEEAEVLGSELEPDLEAIAALDPDVILGSKLRHEALYDQLSQIAPTVFSETIGAVWKDNLSLWAEALCREEQGEELLGAWEQATAEFEQELGELAQTEVSMIRFMPDEVRIYLTGFPGSVLRDAGLDRPDAQEVVDWDESPQLITISQERIPEMDGDVIFVMLSDWTQGEAVELHDDWTSHPLWEQLTAVQNDAVFGINEDHWNLGGGILAANAMLEDLEAHFLGDGGAADALAAS